jgi:hypothetical protein
MHNIFDEKFFHKGNTVGQAIFEHPVIEKVAFTGSTLTGRKILKASAESNLMVVTLELGGKSPASIFEDADLDQVVKWAAIGVLYVFQSALDFDGLQNPFFLLLITSFNMGTSSIYARFYDLLMAITA